MAWKAYKWGATNHLLNGMILPAEVRERNLSLLRQVWHFTLGGECPVFLVSHTAFTAAWLKELNKNPLKFSLPRKSLEKWCNTVQCTWMVGWFWKDSLTQTTVSWKVLRGGCRLADFPPPLPLAKQKVLWPYFLTYGAWSPVCVNFHAASAPLVTVFFERDPISRDLEVSHYSWWFQRFFMFNPYWGNYPIWHIFQTGWNHPLEKILVVWYYSLEPHQCHVRIIWNILKHFPCFQRLDFQNTALDTISLELCLTRTSPLGPWSYVQRRPSKFPPSTHHWQIAWQAGLHTLEDFWVKEAGFPLLGIQSYSLMMIRVSNHLLSTQLFSILRRWLDP